LVRWYAQHIHWPLPASIKPQLKKIEIMKKLFLIVISLGLLSQISAQQIKVFPVFSVSSYQKFHASIGYGIGYDIISKSKNKLGFTFSQSFNSTDYSYIFSSGADGKDYYRDVKPQNQKLSFSTCYSFNIKNSPKSDFFIGPKIGINYFKINESIVEREVNESETQSYTNKYWENNKIGLGLSLEYERNVLSDKLSLSFSTEPELIFFSKFGQMGSSEPPIIGYLSFNLNVIFNLTKSKSTE
jgi:hypothetical protein